MIRRSNANASFIKPIRVGFETTQAKPQPINYR